MVYAAELRFTNSKTFAKFANVWNLIIVVSLIAIANTDIFDEND
jgi:hypothetical protein